MSKEQLIDLDRGQLGLVDAIIRRHIPGKAVWAYGSRVTWKTNEISDLDVVVFDCDAAAIIELREAFEESDLLISVDVMEWENIPENFKENIKKKYVVLQEKTELPGWPEVKLGEVATFNYGKSLPEQSRIAGSVSVYSSAGLIGWHNEALVNSRGLIIGRKGTAGSVYKSENPFFPIDTTFYISENDTDCDLDYLFYKLSNLGLENLNSDSAVPGLNRHAAYAQNIQLPSLPEQKAIAEILSSLDDKIDLLHRQNKTLENMAQALFRQWFVEEADEGWPEKLLGETVDISIGRTPPRKEFQWFSKKQGDWKWISIKDMAGNGTYIFDTSEYLTEEAVDKFNIPVIPSNTVILSFKMTIGRVCITTEDMLSNEAIASFKFRSDTPYSKAYLYFYLKTFRFKSLGSTSSIVTSINTEMIKSFVIPIPDAKLIEKFENTSAPLFSQIRLNQIQVTTLKNLRDTLLPKLMSGDVSVAKSP